MECAGIGKEYGGLTVLDGVTMTLPARGLFGLCGPNGAGKPVTGLWHSLPAGPRAMNQ